MEQIIYRSYRQGGVRYTDVIAPDAPKFQWEFEEGIFMRANPIWAQVTPDTHFPYADISDIFGDNKKPLSVEIGIGNGEFIAHHAANDANMNWLGFEVFHKIFDKAISRARKNENKNIRLLQFDAELFVRMLPLRSVSGFYVNFPDPWPKKKHTKRRLLKSWFIELMRERLVDGGTITIATDHEDYAMEIVENLSAVEGLESTLGAVYRNDLGDYYKTKYYRKFAAEGKVFFFNMRVIR